MTTRGGAKRRPVVLYQPRDEGSVMPLSLLALGSWLAGEHVVIVDGRFELAPEARVVELARVALCLGVTVRTGAPLREAVRVSAAARAANPSSRSCGAAPTRRSTRRRAWPRARWTRVSSARARSRWPRPWRTCARGAGCVRGPAWSWRRRWPAGREAASAPATPLAARRLLAARRRAALREPGGAPPGLLLEPRGEGRLRVDGDPRGARGGRGGATRRAVPPPGDPLPRRGLLRRPRAGGRDRPGPAPTAVDGSAGRRGRGRRTWRRRRPGACASSQRAAAASSTWAWRRECRRASCSWRWAHGCTRPGSPRASSSTWRNPTGASTGSPPPSR